MKVSGSILLDKRGAYPYVHKHNISIAVNDFVSMVKEADACKDTLYYDSEEWELFYAYGYDPTNDYWKEFGSIAYEQLFISSNPLFKPSQIQETDKFENKPMPRTLGGFLWDGCDIDNYVHDKRSINKWHFQWFLEHPEKIDWSKSNSGVLPNYDKAISILRKELKELKKRKKYCDENQIIMRELSFEEKSKLESVEIDRLDPKEVVSLFYSLIMDHKNESGEKIAYAIEIGSKICELNYYQRETELEELNKDNQQIVRIYSIKKGDKYQFLSIDKKHGRFELCDDKGDHICELMFNGDRVNNTQDPNHSILHIEEWKRIYHK